MSGYRHLELLSHGPVCVVRPRHLPNDRPMHYEELERLVAEWNAVADSAHCRTLEVDFSNVAFMTSSILGKLIVLQRRLERKKGKLVLCGIPAEARRVLHWTKLDRVFEIKADAEHVAAVFDVCVKSRRCEETLGASASP